MAAAVTTPTLDESDCRGPSVAPRNEVLLVGRVSGEPQERSLPSGDLLVGWRVVIDRPVPRRPPPEGVRVPTLDTIDCQARAAGVRRSALTLRPGDVVEVTGALRRRFYRSGAVTLSRCEVEVAGVRRLLRPKP